MCHVKRYHGNRVVRNVCDNGFFFCKTGQASLCIVGNIVIFKYGETYDRELFIGRRYFYRRFCWELMVPRKLYNRVEFKVRTISISLYHCYNSRWTYKA